MAQLAPSTAKTAGVVLKKLDQFETQLGKPVNRFSPAQTHALLQTHFRARSVQAVSTTLSYMRKYGDYLIAREGGQNPFEQITDLRAYLNVEACLHKYLTREEADVLRDQLYNDNDQCMMELLFCGMRPEYMVRMKKEDVDFAARRVILRDEAEPVIFTTLSEKAFALIDRTIRQQTYVFNNGTNVSRKNPGEVIANGIEHRTVYFKPGRYVFRYLDYRTAGIPKDQPLRKNNIQEKVRVFRDWAGNPYLTTHTLYISAILDYVTRTYAPDFDLAALPMAEYAKIAALYHYCAPYDADGRLNQRVRQLKAVILEGIPYVR